MKSEAQIRYEIIARIHQAIHEVKFDDISPAHAEWCKAGARRVIKAIAGAMENESPSAIRAATIEECAHQIDLMAGEMFADGETYHFIARALRERMHAPQPPVNSVTTVNSVNSSVRAQHP